MSLLDDLKGIDLSSIVNARASIRVSVETPELKAILGAGAAQAALGGLGEAISTLRNSFENPAALLQPLAGGIATLGGHLSIDAALPTGIASAAGEGVKIVTGLLDGLDGDPMKWGSTFGFSLGDAFEKSGSSLTGYAQVALGEIGKLRRIVDVVEHGVPLEPEAFANLAVDILLPYPPTALASIRDGVNTILAGAASISLPQGRAAGIVVALNGVATAAATRNLTALDAAIRNLEGTRSNMLASIRDDLLAVAARIGSLRLDTALRPMVLATEVLETLDDGILEFLDRFRANIADAHRVLADVDLTKAAAFLEDLLDALEQYLREQFVSRVDDLVNDLEAKLRALFAGSPLRALREQLRSIFHKAADAIVAADLDHLAREVREKLDGLRGKLEAPDLGAKLREQLQAAAAKIEQALDAILSATAAIRDQINAVAGQAQGILQRGADALISLKTQLDEITVQVQGLGIEQAGQQVTDTLSDLRNKAETLLSVQPLPEPLRPLVDQLIAQIQAVDLEAAIDGPVHEALAQIKIPPEIEGAVRQSLDGMRMAVENLIPTSLIDSIEKEIGGALDVLRGFDPAQLLGGISGALGDAAGFIEKLNPQSLVTEIRKPFQALLDLVDAIEPTKLLKPAIDGFDSLLERVSLPGPATALRRGTEAIDGASRTISHAALQPLTQLAPSGAAGTSGSGDNAPALEGVRPGDVIRMFGYLPNKLRAALVGIEAGAAGAALGALHNLTGSLAEKLLGLPETLAAMETKIRTDFDTLLEPIGEAQLNAQLALSANFVGGSVRVDASFDAVAQASPGRLRADMEEMLELACGRAREAVASFAGSGGAALDRAALLLGESPLAALTGDLEKFLAALDPEPLAVELDAFVAEAMQKVAATLPEITPALEALIARLGELVHDLNPATQAIKFLRLLDVLKGELDVLNPRRLAEDLAVVHAAIRNVIGAYDPAVFAAELTAIIGDLAGKIRALNPATLLGDLSFLDTIKNKIKDATPADALKDVGAELKEIGETLAMLDPGKLLASADGLTKPLEDAFKQVVAAIKSEILALLESLRFAGGGASVSVSVSAEANV
jgi:hypothetical protein